MKNPKLTALLTALHLDAYRKRREETNTYTMSRPIKKNVHGIIVRRATVGQYIEIAQRMPNILLEALDATFPGMKTDDILKMLSAADKDQSVVRDLITRLVSVMPDKILDILSEVIGTSKQKLYELSLTELLDVLEEFYKLNDYNDFFSRVRRAADALRKRQNGQSNDGLPVRTASESASES